MQTYLIELLECPACHGSLAWDISARQGDRIVEGVARCCSCDADYPIREEIGVFLTPDLPRNDLWEQGGQKLSQMLSLHPEIQSQLMDVRVSELEPADCFFRGMVLEEQGEWNLAKEAFDSAMSGLYTDEYRACWQSQVDYVIERVDDGTEPIVDLASGRCYLVRDLIDATERPIVATDFSPTVLRRNQAWLTHHGLIDRVSLLAFDARRTPFRDGSIGIMTTNVGLPNIAEPGDLLSELRRSVSGRLLAISHFYSASDVVNVAALREYGLADSMLLDPVLANFRNAGWLVNVENLCSGRAMPTPKGVVLAGQGIDAFPVAETTLDWCVLEAA